MSGQDRPGGALAAAAQDESEAMKWDRVAAHIHAAVIHQLPEFGGRAPGGSVCDREAWRTASPEVLADRITTFAMAAIAPVLTAQEVDNGVRMMRAVLDRAGIDPATLPWHEPTPTS